MSAATKTGGKGVRAVVAKGAVGLAWASYVLAVTGGALLPGTFIGDMIGGFLGWFPDWVAPLLLFAGFVVMCIDLFLDMVPNQLAIWMGILLPSVAAGVDGDLGDWVTEQSQRVVREALPRLTDLLGEAPQLALALAATAGALLVARRVVKKGAA